MCQTLSLLDGEQLDHSLWFPLRSGSQQSWASNDADDDEDEDDDGGVNSKHFHVLPTCQTLS